MKLSLAVKAVTLRRVPGPGGESETRQGFARPAWAASGASARPIHVRWSLAAACLAMLAGCSPQVAELTPTADAGLCTDDSQCRQGTYCDFTVTACPFDGGLISFAVINPGTCLPAAGAPGGHCHSGDDCPESELCLSVPPAGVEPMVEFECTREGPCDAGLCQEITGLDSGAVCPDGCSAAFPPHARDYPCVCAGNSCAVPVADAGMRGLTDGGPAVDIFCVPSGLDFLGVVSGQPTTLSTLCTSPYDLPLPVQTTVLEGSVFTAQLGQSTPGSVLIDVTYNPSATETDNGVLEVDFGQPIQASVTIFLAGSAIAQPACNLSRTPSVLNFGEVKVGATRTEGFTMTDVGSGECLVTGSVSLPADCPPAFSLPDGPTNLRLGASGNDAGYPTSVLIIVAFTPPDVGTFSCGNGSLSGTGVY